MVPVSSAYLEPRIWVSSLPACRPDHASLRAACAWAGWSARSAAAVGFPVASAAKNGSAVGSGPFGLGVQALSMAAVATTAMTAAPTRETDEEIVAIEANVKSMATVVGGG